MTAARELMLLLPVLTFYQASIFATNTSTCLDPTNYPRARSFLSATGSKFDGVGEVNGDGDVREGRLELTVTLWSARRGVLVLDCTCWTALINCERNFSEPKRILPVTALSVRRLSNNLFVWLR